MNAKKYEHLLDTGWFYKPTEITPASMFGKYLLNLLVKLGLARRPAHTALVIRRVGALSESPVFL